MPPPANAASGAWAPPEEFDGFRVRHPLGRGGMGHVYLALEVSLDREVALKFIGTEPTREARDRFLVEARAIARLQHPNVVSIFRIGEIDGLPYLAYEFVRGKSLDKIGRAMDWPDVLSIGLGLARGLGAAHQRGVIHRDVKPANAILTESGEAKLLDFGLAKLVDGAPPDHIESGPESVAARVAAAATFASRPTSSTVPMTPERVTPGDPGVSGALTRTGTILGTPLYLPPELWDGSAATSRSDVYALGLVLYELCTGAHPLAGLMGDELVRRAQAQVMAPLRTRRADIPELFAEAIDRCLRRVPEERFRDGDELAAALASADAIFRSLGLVGRRSALDSDAESTLVAASFARVAPRSDVVVSAFYARLFELAPDVRPMFPAEMKEQRVKFASTLQSRSRTCACPSGSSRCFMIWVASTPRTTCRRRTSTSSGARSSTR